MDPTLVPPAIEPAELTWRNGVPESKQLGVTYFNRGNGLEALRHNFIEYNDLPARFAKVPQAGSFVVAELGFGTGLNFLATWQAWQCYGPAHAATLHYVSTERFPLRLEDLKKALLCWPELEEFAEELTANYPPLTRGTHRVVLAGGRVRLTLFFGETNDALNNLSFHADVWHPGRATSAEESYALEETSNKPISQRQKSHSPEQLSKSVAIIGAGIAGCLLANNLAQRGYAVTLVESANQPGQSASGNLQGATYVKLGVEFNHQTELGLSALTFSHRYYSAFCEPWWHPTGLLQLAWSDAELSRQRRFIERNRYPEEILRPVTRQEAEALAGIGLQTGGLWFPRSGWLEPSKLCKSLASHPSIHKMFRFSVESMVTSHGKWHISGTSNESLEADHVVICGGHLSPQLIPGTDTFRFRTIRGQVTHMPERHINSPQTVICGARYLNPVHATEDESLAVIGATFDLHSNEPEATTEGHRENIRELAAMVPMPLSQEQLSGNLPDQLEGRVGFRCTTHDYQPVAGPILDTNGQTCEGLYLLTGFGSKGLTYAPLLAEYIADHITDQPQALPTSLARRLATERMRLPKVAAT